MLTFEIRNTRTGELELPFTASKCPWRSQIDPGAAFTTTIKGRDAERPIPRSLLHALTEPTGEFSVAVREGEKVLAAGVIVDSEVDDDASEIQMQCEDINLFWDRRLGASVRFIGLAGLTIQNRSAPGFVRAVLWRAMDELNPDFPRWHLPVDLPPDGAGSFSLDTEWYEFRLMGELLDLVRDRGYEIHHKPYLTAGGQLRYSTTVAQSIVGGVVPLVYGASNSPVSKLRYRRDGKDLASGVLRVGNGEGVDTLTRFAAADEIGAPIRHILNTDAKSVSDGDWLQAAADADIAVNGPPQVSWSLKVSRTDEFPLSAFLPGEAIALDIRDHWIIPDGIHKLRIVGLSGDADGQSAVPEVIPYGAA